MFSKRLFKRNKKINGKGAKIMIKKRNENDNKFSEFIEKYRAKTKLIGYGIFMVFVRNDIRIVLAISRTGKMYTVVYNGSWNNWKPYQYAS